MSIASFPTLFDEIERPYDKSIARRFERFHKENPEVYGKLVNMALGLKRKGHKKWGMKNLFEILRWQWGMETVSEDEFRLNNDFTAPYARLLMAQVPELKDFFETRIQKSGGSQS